MLIRYSIRTLNCIVETVVHYISVCGLHLHAKEDQATNQTKKTKLTSPELHGRQ